jgi:hypothetical protein
MSKKKTNQNYLPGATDEQIALSETKIIAIKRAARKPKKLKIEPILETVVRCLALGKSSRTISKIVMDVHKYEIRKDSILRFARTLPTAHSA